MQGRHPPWEGDVVSPWSYPPQPLLAGSGPTVLGSSNAGDSHNFPAGQQLLGPPIDQLRQSSKSPFRIPTTIPDPDSIEEDGRMYHAYKFGKYLFPNDGEEQDRLDFQHRVMSMILKNRLAWAPIQDPRNVLDIATGTGIWTIEFAKQHPTAQVTGTDLSSIQPKHGLPPNVNFITREDAEDEWLFPGLEPFDYVHLRLVSTCFNNPRTVIRQAFSHLLPGGWIEFQDSTLELAGMDTTPLHDTSPLARFFQTCIRGAAKMGRDVCVTKHYRNWLVEAGFVEVVEREMPPGFLSNRWTLENEEYQEIGRYSHANLSRWIDNAGRYLKLAGLSKEQIVELQKRAQEDLRDRGTRRLWSKTI